MNNTQYIKTKLNWFYIIFGSFFAVPALGIFMVSVVLSVSESIQMKSWHSASAIIQSADIGYYQGGEGGTTYLAKARYQYQVDGITYNNSRVQISSGSDNIGSFQKDVAGKLRANYANGEPVTIYYNPKNPADSIIYRELRWGLLLFTSMFVLLFGGAGFGVMYWGWRGNKTNVSLQTSSEPWLSEVNWMNNTIYSDSKSGFISLAIIAVFWNAISWLFVFVGLEDAYKDEGLMVTLIILMFPAAGLGILYLAIKSWKQWRKFGRTPLVLSPFPGQVGGDVGGTIQFQQRLPDQDEYLATLSLLRSYTTGSGDDKETEEELVWHKEGLAKLKQVLTADVESELKFRFKTHDNLPESNTGTSSDYYIWRITIENKQIGLIHNFDIPVFNVAGQALSGIDRQEYSSVSDRPNTTDNRRNQKVSMEKYLPFKDSRGSFSDQSVIHYPLFRKVALNSLFALIGGFFFAVGIYLWFEKDAPAIMGMFFCFLGGLACLAGLYGMSHSLTITMANNRLEVVKTILGLSIKRHSHNYSEVKSVISKELYRSNSGNKHSIHYNILAVLDNGKKIKLAEAENDIAQNLIVDFFNKKLG